MTLAELQQAFLAELAGKPQDAFRQCVVDNRLAGKMSKPKRISVYQQTHVAARVGALENIYPICRQILGEALFDRIACEYVAANPSLQWDLNIQGANFYQALTQKIAEHQGLSELVYLPDLARLEWYFHLCYYAPINPQHQPTSDDPEQITFAPDSSLQLFECEWPVAQIWQLNRQSKDEDESKNEDEQSVEHNQEVYYHLVHREEFAPQVYTLEAAQYALLQDSLNGLSLAALAEKHGKMVSTTVVEFIQRQWIYVA